ncbi:MAG: glycosyltransferase family 2 protein [Chloroflexi bacterium]|nr:glycosyltransferase family 2 protein [Chloroflexota bacterium]
MNDHIIAVVPAWNEGVRIKPVLEGILTHLLVLVVDDGSHDDTVAVAESVGAAVVRHSQNRGKGAALVTGFQWALAHGYEAALTLDADGQHDPNEIPKFVAAYENGVGDLIIGRRSFRKMPFPRPVTTPVGTWLLSMALKQPIYDNQSGYRLYTRRCMESIKPTTTGFEFEVEVIVQAVCNGIPIGWVDIQTIYNIDKVSYFHPVHDTVRFLRMVWRARQERIAWEDGRQS